MFLLCSTLNPGSPQALHNRADAQSHATVLSPGRHCSVDNVLRIWRPVSEKAGRILASTVTDRRNDLCDSALIPACRLEIFKIALLSAELSLDHRMGIDAFCLLAIDGA